jgi:hypothetical protein
MGSHVDEIFALFVHDLPQTGRYARVSASQIVSQGPG